MTLTGGWAALRATLFALLFLAAGGAMSKTELAIEGMRFTLNGKPVFLLGISYYGGLGAPDEILNRDLDEIRRDGFNWIRVWATWAAFGKNVSAVDAAG